MLSRVDVVVQAARFVYVLKIKRDGAAAKALEQIEERGYAASSAVGPRQVVLVGAAFDSYTRQLSDWEARDL